MLSCGLRRPRMRRSLRRARLRNRPGQCGGFEVTRMRSRVFNGLYHPIYELTQFMIQGYEHRDAKRPGSLATRFQAVAAASTMAS